MKTLSRLFAVIAVVIMNIAQSMIEGGDYSAKSKLRQAGVSGYVYAVQNFPCQHCNGEGAIFVNGDDAVACPRCRGLKVDPLYLLEPVL